MSNDDYFLNKTIFFILRIFMQSTIRVKLIFPTHFAFQKDKLTPVQPRNGFHQNIFNIIGEVLIHI